MQTCNLHCKPGRTLAHALWLSVMTISIARGLLRVVPSVHAALAVRTSSRFSCLSLLQQTR